MLIIQIYGKLYKIVTKSKFFPTATKNKLLKLKFYIFLPKA